MVRQGIPQASNHSTRSARRLRVRKLVELHVPGHVSALQLPPRRICEPRIDKLGEDERVRQIAAEDRLSCAVVLSTVVGQQVPPLHLSELRRQRRDELAQPVPQVARSGRQVGTVDVVLHFRIELQDGKVWHACPQTRLNASDSFEVGEERARASVYTRFQVLGHACSHARLAPRAKLHCSARLANCLSMSRQSVEERIRCSIVGLAHVPINSHGGEHQKYMEIWV
mmetsp:Transcript_60998/g.178394  ORF Transcript_60998/g.178394 Transcript_60998/m.178394 type:complete len:226 (+) Transcript_60998:40-717(+)